MCLQLILVLICLLIFNVKIIETTPDYPKLYINNNLIATSSFGGDVFGNSTYQAGFVFGTVLTALDLKLKL